MSGVSFDRAASFYDETRGLPAGARQAVAELLSAELSGRDRCLEVGVGTGRIALPLSLRGVELIGVDIAPAMLARLVANAGGVAPFPLLRADVTQLPLATRSCDAVIACHVLHLIPDWRALLDEAVRVLKPGRSILVDFGGEPPAPWNEESVEILGRFGISAVRPGMSRPEPVAEYLGARARGRALPPIEVPVERSLRQDLDEWRNQIHAWTWPYQREQMEAACDEVLRYATEQGWPLDTPVPVESKVEWWSFDLTG